jgi:hypothetical protein
MGLLGNGCSSLLLPKGCFNVRSDDYHRLSTWLSFVAHVIGLAVIRALLLVPRSRWIEVFLASAVPAADTAFRFRSQA